MLKSSNGFVLKCQFSAARSKRCDYKLYRYIYSYLKNIDRELCVCTAVSILCTTISAVQRFRAILNKKPFQNQAVRVY